MNIGTLSYSVAAISFVLLAVLLMTSWRGRLKGGLLVIAVVISAAWSLSALFAGNGSDARILGYYFLEIARNVAWFTFLYRILEPLKDTDRGHAALLRYSVPVVLLASAVLFSFYIIPMIYSQTVVRVYLNFASLAGHLVLAVIGLIMVEQVFRNTKPEQRWAIKPLLLGIGGMFAYDFFLYADALLFNRIDEGSWAARGLINALIVPMIGISAVRNLDWSLDIFVSRKMIFHTASLVGAGLYLIIMAIAGYYIRLYGGGWGTAAQAVFLFLAIVLLIVLMFSGQMRAKAKVFLNKHFFNYKYDYREEWLKLSRLLATEGDKRELHENAIKALSDIVDSTGGMLWVRKEAGHYVYVAHWNMNQTGLDNVRNSSSLIHFMQETKWVVDLDEYEENPEMYSGMQLPGWLKDIDRAWLLVPLIQNDELLGFIVLARPRAARQINWEDRDLLKTVGMQVASHIALLETTEQLMDARQFEAFNRLSSFVVHDLKNLSAQLSLVLSNAEKHKTNPAFIDDMISTIGNTTKKMNRMLQHLRKENNIVASKEVFNLRQVIREMIDLRSVDKPVPTCNMGEEKILLNMERERLFNVLAHMVQNAQQATSEGGSVALHVSSQAGEVAIRITDTGCGMDQTFIRERLFRPFDTTKGNAGMGIGVYESRSFIWSQGGDLKVTSEEKVGTTFTISLPVFKQHAEDDGITMGVVN